MAKKPADDNQPTCKTCRHWLEDSEPGEGGSGTCRRDPPAVMFDGETGIFCAWPQTDATDWCGSHAQRLQ